MHESVRECFIRFTEKWEGRISWPYLDVRGLVTVGLGNLIDPISLARGLPWEIAGRPATDAEITTDWQRVKSEIQLAAHGAKSAKLFSSIRLSDTEIDRMVLARLETLDLIMAGEYPGWDSMPADAQLGILSMCWAVGSAMPRKFPRFSATVREQDWLGARAECAIRETNPDGSPNRGIIPRNVANRLCFANAAVQQQRLDSAHSVQWPATLEF